jgi:hypothetical protein
MSLDVLKGRKCMVWTFMGNTRMYTALKNYGDRLSQVGLFSFKVDATGTITESGVAISDMLAYINKYPHITWLLTVRNDGTSSVFTALRENTDGAQDKFLTELVRIMGKYPWCDGVDIDLERGGDYSTHAKSTAMFHNIWNTVKAYDRTKKVNICLPGMNAVNGSVGGENWCVYADLNAYCDTASIMSYGMAWAGSAPGPVSPKDWLDGIYDYASRVMTPGKGVHGASRLRLELADLRHAGKPRRDLPGRIQHLLRGEELDDGKVQLHGRQASAAVHPDPRVLGRLQQGALRLPAGLRLHGRPRRHKPRVPAAERNLQPHHYLTAYGKQQKPRSAPSTWTVTGRRTAIPASSPAKTASPSWVTAGARPTASPFPSSGTYDIAVRLCYPFWDKNGIYVSIDGTKKHFTESRLWWPYWRSTFWASLADGITLSAGTHTITVSVDVKGVQFHGFRVCSEFSEAPVRRLRILHASPTKFIDVDGNECQPDKGFKLTTEVLRRKPDSALIWYADFEDPGMLETGYWKTLSGSWKIWRRTTTPRTASIPSSTAAENSHGTTTDSEDIHLRARLAFPGSTGSAGVFCGSLFCCLNYDTQAVELWNGSTKLGSYSQSISQTRTADLRSDPTMYTIEMRIREAPCASIPAHPIRSDSPRASADSPEARPDTRATAGPSANSSAWATHGPTSHTNASTSPSRTAPSRSTAGSAARTAHGTTSSRCSR